MNKLLTVLLALLLAGCASVVKVEGDQVLNSRLEVRVDEAWNRLTLVDQPYQVWTQEGATLDQLRLWSGIASGQPLVKPPRASGELKAPAVPTFQAGMSMDQLVSLFERVFAVDGSVVKVVRAEPGPFAGRPGVRFELAVTRRLNHLQLRVAGWAVVHGEELYAATFSAPQLAFYPRLLPRAEQVLATARFKGT